MKIEIYGAGCAKCKATFKAAKKAVESLGMEVELVKVEEMEEILGKGIMMTPALAIDGEIKATGRIPKKDEIIGWLKSD
ncbi:MAG: hypothetical protein CVT48_03765 [Thermoplasmata archaeon HGW-Thermoplasmata-1]|nr:MAG: hypothetical protein CVT48_03765 [Thermoplasmata archaeon HGW-Thermoplasmata-1]